MGFARDVANRALFMDGGHHLKMNRTDSSTVQKKNRQQFTFTVLSDATYSDGIHDLTEMPW